MAIVSTSTVKSILNISTTEKDAWIDALIPQVEQDYVSIRGKSFDVGTRIRFQTAAPLAVDEEMEIVIGNYVSAGHPARGSEYTVLLRAGDTADIIARRALNQILPSSYYNLFTANSSSSSADLYLTERFESCMENYSVLDVTVSASMAVAVDVSKMQTIYPDGAEFTAARMIQYHMNAGRAEGLESESLGDYSVKYRTESKAQDYPKPIVAGIKRFLKTF